VLPGCRNRTEQHEEYEKSGVKLDLVYDATGSLYSSHAGGGGVTGSLPQKMACSMMRLSARSTSKPGTSVPETNRQRI
jgi:hypothetical protein